MRSRLVSVVELGFTVRRASVLGEKPNLILCFFCRPEQAEPDSCLGKLKNWCLNCVVSEAAVFRSGFVNFRAQKRC